MGAVVMIDALLRQRRVWKGQPAALPPSLQPTEHAELDAALPTGRWPEAALSELLIPADGIGELQLPMADVGAAVAERDVSCWSHRPTCRSRRRGKCLGPNPAIKGYALLKFDWVITPAKYLLSAEKATQYACWWAMRDRQGG